MCLALVAWRVTRLAVIARPDGLIVRNIRNTHRIRWTEVEEIFQPGPVPAEVYLENPLARRKWGLFIRLTEGAVISATLFSDRFIRRQWPGSGRALNEAVRDLNELRRQYS